MCLIGNKQHSRIIVTLLELHFFCQNWPLFCLHFTSSWNQKAVTEQIYSFSLYLALKDQNGARFNLGNNKKKKKRRSRKVPNLGCVDLTVLQYSEKSFRKELRQKNTQTQNKCTAEQVFYKEKEFAIRTTACCVLFPGESLTMDNFQTKIFTWKRVYF